MFILLFRDVPVCSVVLSLRFVFVGRPLFFFSAQTDICQNLNYSYTDVLEHIRFCCFFVKFAYISVAEVYYFALI